MENTEKQNKIEDYKRKIELICSKKNELDKLLTEPINVNNNIIEGYLVNKDILDYYSNLSTDKIKSNYARIEKENTIISLLLEPELLTINNFKFPYNFYIVNKELLDLIVVEKNKVNSFKPYNILIWKEGIFIWNKEDKQNDYYLIYYLIDNNSEINKIYLYKNLKDFNQELQTNILRKKMNEYFSFRNIRKKDVGFFNIIDDGNIIGKYFNLIKENCFKFDEKINDDSTILVTKNYIQKEDKKFKDFLTYLLIGLYYINELYIILNKRDENLKKDKNKLINIFNEFVSYFRVNNKPNYDHINEFINVFFSKGLNETIYYNNNDIKFYLDLIETIINQFYNELFIENLNENNTYNNNNNILKEFSNLFFGQKYDQHNKEKHTFCILYKNQKQFENEEQNIFNLEQIFSDLYLKDEGIIHLPQLLIIILDNKEVSIEIPLELNISKEKKNYLLLNYIPKTIDRLYSIIYNINKDNNIDSNNDNNKDNKTIWENYFKDPNNFSKYLVNSNDEIKNSIIFFYKYKRESSYCSGINGIYNQNIDNDKSTYLNKSNQNIDESNIKINFKK